METKFFKRGNQFWKENEKGEILIINTQAPKQHYNGDAHILLNKEQFNPVGSIEISERDWKKIRDAHLLRLKSF